MSKASSLERDALGLVQSAVIGIAGTSPAYSIAATSAILIGAVGALAPASLLYCALIMFGITYAFVCLNRMEPNAGATYAWVSRVFNDTLGFFAGWTVLVTSTLFMVSATIPAASATLLLVAPDQIGNKLVVAAAALGWLLAVSLVVVRGVVVTAAVQTVMTCVELGVLAVVGGAAAWRFGGVAPHELGWNWLSPTRFDAASFSSGAVISLFFLWGWDVALNLNEETRNPNRTPGLGAVAALIVIVVTFVGFTTVTLEALSDEEIRRSSTNVIYAIADKLFPRPWSYVAVLAVMLSTIGTLQTSVLQFSRTLFAKSRAGALDARWAAVHARWKTPAAATILITVLGVLLLVLSLLFDTVDGVMKASIEAIGVQVAYYYGLAGFACAWHFRRQAGRSLAGLLFTVAWPGASATALWAAAVFALLQMETPTALIAVGGVLLGFIPLALRRRASPASR